MEAQERELREVLDAEERYVERVRNVTLAPLLGSRKIICTLRVVPEWWDSDLLKMPPQDYFTAERFLKAGVSPKVHLRKVRRLIEEGLPDEEKLLGDLLALTRKGIIQRSHYAGKSFLTALETILKKDGLPLL